METAVQLAIFAIEEAIKEEPAIAAALKDIFTKADPTAADWAALRARIAAKDYADYVPDSALSAAPAPAPAAAPALTVLDASVTAPVAPAAPVVQLAPEPAPAVPVFTGQVADPHA
jgi:hypothetical protein